MVIVLTILTQSGGIVWIIFKFITKSFEFNFNRSYKLYLFKFFTFLFIYSFVSFALIPPLAKKYGRVRLPLNSPTLEPVTAFTVITNRNYVKPELLSTLEMVSNDLKKQFPELKIGYLDASFPFFDGYPLLPHLSHNDGKKIDLAFFYRKNAKITNEKPSKSGYGYYVNKNAEDLHKYRECISKGNWQYDFPKYLTFGMNKELEFDEKSTALLIRLLLSQSNIKRVLLEPYLKVRLGLRDASKVRYQGCHSVRHDDHIHIELK